jgi:YfiH family protein
MDGDDLRWREMPGVWGATRGDVEVRFVGRSGATTREEILSSVASVADVAGIAVPRLAWAQQVHGASVLAARPGLCGPGDALITAERGLALAIATADCVPVLLAAGATVAAVHAGWRGLVAGVIGAAVERLGHDASGIRAWIGPAIGPCCYEVGEEVATAIDGAGRGDAVLRRDARPRPHLDLHAAARLELAACGVRAVQALAICTRCSPALWSYRRDGTAAGRNLAFIWRR